MNIHEYQAKELMKLYGIPVPAQYPAESRAEAEAAAKQLGGRCVVKAQIHAGGRGKAGGVKLAADVSEAGRIAEEMLGSTLVTKQTGIEGKVVHTVLVTSCVSVAQEYYLAITMDPSAGCPVIIASASGGVEIEKIAQEHPDAILRLQIPITVGLRDYHGYAVAHMLGFAGKQCEQLVAMLHGMYRLFIEKDCSLLEINPLAQLEDGALMALDAKIVLDDNGLVLHPEHLAMDDPRERSQEEQSAIAAGLSYIPLNGNVACLVNGAGLAMATMDMIMHYGGAPANFLDVGGSASVEKVTAAFSILLASERVKSVLVNIFGGIMKCDVIAEGIIHAVKTIDVRVPVVVRLEGTNADKGKALLKASGMDIIPANDLSDAVAKAVRAAGGDMV